MAHETSKPSIDKNLIVKAPLTSVIQPWVAARSAVGDHCKSAVDGYDPP